MYRLEMPIKIKIKNQEYVVTVVIECETLDKDHKIILLKSLQDLSFSSDSEVYEVVLSQLMEVIYALLIEDHGGPGFYVEINLSMFAEYGIKYSYSFNRKGIKSMGH